MRKFGLMVSILLLVSSILAACGSSGQSSSGSSESVTWLVNSGYPESNHIGQGIVSFSNKVNEATDGKVKFELRPDGQLGYEGSEMLKVVRDGTVEASDVLLGSVAGDESLYGLTTLPSLFQNMEEARILFDIARPYFEKVAEEKWNQKLLYIAPWPLSGFWTKNEVKTLDDLKGLKMRSFDEMSTLAVQAVGGTPAPLAFSEVYSALSTGVIDSVLTSSVSAVDGKFWEVLGYHVPAGVLAGSNALTINLDKFNSLDKESQDAILQAAKEVEEEIWNEVKETDEEMLSTVKENGITILEPSDELLSDIGEATKSIREDWLKTAPDEAKEIVEKFYEAVGR
ncbi:TRAP transporter substrate-binding protein [Robertmurraya massiliosenegalensis]|uniref:TRAP transporter substrate-binding protein n=1 Tax=Robertmurraya TaxID=2837507 RepID=UPI0039A422ED